MTFHKSEETSTSLYTTQHILKQDSEPNIMWPGFDSCIGCCWYWGQVLPRPSVLRWAISRAFLCGVCMFSPCSQGVSSTKNPNRKTCRRTELSVPDQDGSLDLVPGRLKAAHCSWGPGGRTVQDGIKAESKFTATSACVCVCVCPVSPPIYARVCCCVSFVPQ